MTDKRRDRIEIYKDILKISEPGVIKTQIVYGANLNFDIASRYIDKLITNELLVLDGKIYTTTEKGMEYITAVENIVL